MDRFTADELEWRVDEVLFYKWDPVGINHYVSARAEYRSYVQAVLKVVSSGERLQIIDALQSIQVDAIGDDFDSELAGEIADLLLSHKEAIDNGHA